MIPKCATCVWFERSNGIVAKGQEHLGLCFYAPPVIQVVMPSANVVTGRPGSPSVQGLRPPTGENDRCHHHEEL